MNGSAQIRTLRRSRINRSRRIAGVAGSSEAKHVRVERIPFHGRTIRLPSPGLRTERRLIIEHGRHRRQEPNPPPPSLIRSLRIAGKGEPLSTLTLRICNTDQRRYPVTAEHPGWRYSSPFPVAVRDESGKGAGGLG